MSILLLLVKAHLPVAAFLRAFLQLLGTDSVTAAVLLFSLQVHHTQSHTLRPRWAWDSVVQPQSTGYWCNLCSQTSMPSPIVDVITFLIWSLQLFVFFSFLLLSFLYSILWGNDEKCHLWSYRLSWFPWQLQQQSDVPLGPGGPWRPPASHSLWEGGSGRGWWQVVYTLLKSITRWEWACTVWMFVCACPQLIDGTELQTNFLTVCLWTDH